MRSMRNFGGALASLLALGLSTAAGDERDDLLETVRRGNRASIEAVRTLSCDVASEYTPRSEANETFSYFQQGARDRVRCRTKRRNETEDCLLEGAKNTYVIETPGTEAQGSIRPRQPVTNPDLWFMALFTHAWAGSRVPFEKIVAGPHQLETVDKVAEAGRSLVRVTFSYKSGKFTIWFDPMTNYLACKSRKEKGDYVSELKITSFCEPAPGIFFPNETQATISKPKSTWKATFSNVRINQELPADVFSFRFPPGILVIDRLKNEVHRTDANGEPTLPGLDQRGRQLTVAKGEFPPFTEGQGPRGRQSEQEPVSRYWWVLPASFVLLLTSGILWLVRKRRSATGS